MEVRFILSETGKKLLVFENQVYYQAYISPTDGKVRWRCIRKEGGCTAKVHTANADSTVLMDKDVKHNHEEDSRLVGQNQSNNGKRKLTKDQYQRPAKVPNSGLKTNTPSPEMLTIDCVPRDVLAAQPTPPQQFNMCNSFPVQPTHELQIAVNSLNLQLELTRNENKMLKDMCYQNTVTFHKQSKAETSKCLAFTTYLGNIINDLQNNNQEKMRIIQQKSENETRLNVENEQLKVQNEIFKVEIQSLREKFEASEKLVNDLTGALEKRADEISVITSMQNEYPETCVIAEEKIIPVDSDHCSKCKEAQITKANALTLVQNYAKKMDELSEQLTRQNKNRKIHS